MIKAVVFDLDGTLLDTFPGIMESANEVAEMMGKERVEDRDRFEPFTRMPLTQGFPTVFGVEKEKAEKAKDLFISRYEEKGCLSYEYYYGIMDAVKELAGAGIRMGISTLKTEGAAKRMIASSRLAPFIETIRGNSATDDAVKSELILKVLSDLGTEPSDALVIGDTTGDRDGALEAGVRFLGVEWGFGSASLAGTCEMAARPDAICGMILS